MNNIEINLRDIRAQIASAASACERSADSILLLAVSKKKPASDIRVAFACGQRDFGENYLQEALEKMQELQDLDINWHFIGAIQSNKTRSIAEAFDWVHCVDRLKIAKRLSEQRPATLPPLNICIQVNIDHEASKAAIPAPRADYSGQCRAFARLAEALTSLRQQGLDCDTLSMGMTQDMEAAISQGSTLVRIGTAIFGERL
jgi:hypothetical protein